MTLNVALRLAVVVGVSDGVAVPVPVAEVVGVPLPVALAVTLPLREIDPVLDGLAPAVSDEVGDTLVVVLAVRVEEGVGAAVSEPDCVGEAVGAPVPVCEAVGVALSDTLGVMEDDAP